MSSENENAIEIIKGIKVLSKGRFLVVPVKNTKSYKDVLIGNDVYISGFPSSIGIKKIPQISNVRLTFE